MTPTSLMGDRSTTKGTDRARRARSVTAVLMPGDGRPSRIGAAALVVALAIAFVAPLFVDSVFQIQVLTNTFLGAALAAGLVLSLGWTGLLNLSHGTMYGIGAYTTAVLVADHGWSFVASIPVAMALAALGGVILGLASLRVSGDYFALVSLAFTIAIFEVFRNWEAVTHGVEGFLDIPTISLFGQVLSGFKPGYYTTLILLVLIVGFVALLTTTFAGRAMLAVRFDPLAAESMGINVLYTRLLSMGLSGALAGIAGSVLVATVLIIEPNNFNLIESFNTSLWVIIGGMASLPGTVFAAGIITFAMGEFQFLADYSVGLIGIVVLVAVFLRGGVVRDLIEEIMVRRRVRREVAERA